MGVDLIIKNGKIVSTSGIYEFGIAVDEGKIVAMAKDSCLPSADKTIDAKGSYVFPGIIDPHTHLDFVTRDFELESRLETAAAAYGGTTTVMHLIASKGSHKSGIRKYTDIAQRTSLVDMVFYVSMGSEQQIDEMEDYMQQGVTSCKFFLNRGEYDREPIVDDGQLLVAWEKLRELGGLAMCHCENNEIARVMVERLKDKKVYPGIWNDCRPWQCEYESMGTAITIAEMAKCPLYIVHVSIGQGLDLGVEALHKGAKLYLETCPHYLTLQANDPTLIQLEKVNPPLRGKWDNERLWRGIEAGYIHCIGSDSAANKMEEKMGKNDFWSVLPDWSGVETMFPVVLTEGLKRGLTLEKLTEVCSFNAARIHGIPKKGSIEIGNDADFTIVDLKNKKKFTKDMMVGYGDWSPFEGWELIWPTMTIVRGKVVVDNGQITGKPGTANIVKTVPRSTKSGGTL